MIIKYLIEVILLSEFLAAIVGGIFTLAGTFIALWFQFRKDDKDKRKEDKKDDKKEESKGLLCDFFPDILACDKMGKPEEGMFDAISIPQTTDDRTWSSDDFLPPNGVCPQPKSFNIWGKPVQISYEPLCVFMEKVRFAVLLGFIIMSAFIVFGSLRK